MINMYKSQNKNIENFTTNSKLKNTKIFMGYGAGAVLKEDGSVITWGSKQQAGDSSVTYGGDLKSDVVDISIGYGAGAVLKRDGSVVTWGRRDFGGNPSYSKDGGGPKTIGGEDIATKLSSGVISISMGKFAGAALKNDGSVVTWGSDRNGGNSSNAIGGDLNSGVKSISMKGTSGVALKEDGSVVTWGSGGDPREGTDPDYTFNMNVGGETIVNELKSGVVAISGGVNSAAALKNNGKLITWGARYNGGMSSEDKILFGTNSNNLDYINMGYKFGGGLRNGSVVIWANERWNPDHPSLMRRGGQISAVAQDVVDLKIGYNTAAALKKNGSVIVWGNQNKGGTPAYYHPERPKEICKTYYVIWFIW